MVGTTGDTARAKKRCMLLEIAPELRNRIYDEVFQQDPDTTVTVEPPSEHLHSEHLPGLLLTCKQIHKEATSIYYASTTFTWLHSDIDSADSANPGLSPLPPRYRSLIPKVRFLDISQQEFLDRPAMHPILGAEERLADHARQARSELLIQGWKRFTEEQIEVPWLNHERSGKGWEWVPLTRVEQWAREKRNGLSKKFGR